MLCHSMTCSKHHKKPLNLKDGDVLCNECNHTIKEPEEEGLEARLEFIMTLIEAYNTLYLKASQLPKELRKDARQFRDHAKGKNISNITTNSTGAASGIATIVGAALLLTPAAPAGMACLGYSSAVGLMSAGARIGTEITVSILQNVDSFSHIELLDTLEVLKTKLNNEFHKIVNELKEYQDSIDVMYMSNQSVINSGNANLNDQRLSELKYADFAQTILTRGLTNISTVSAEEGTLVFNALSGITSAADDGIQSAVSTGVKVGATSAAGIVLGTASLGLNIVDLVKEVDLHIKGNPAPIADLLDAYASSIEQMDRPDKLIGHYESLKTHLEKLTEFENALNELKMDSNGVAQPSKILGQFNTQIAYVLVGTAIYMSACGIADIDGNADQILSLAKFSVGALVIFYALAATQNTAAKMVDDFNENMQNEAARKNMLELAGNFVGSILGGAANKYVEGRRE